MLDEVLGELPHDLRTVFVMCEVEEVTMSEVAVALGIPAGTVASRLRRAREAFAVLAAATRARLDAEAGDE